MVIEIYPNMVIEINIGIYWDISSISQLRLGLRLVSLFFELTNHNMVIYGERSLWENSPTHVPHLSHSIRFWWSIQKTPWKDPPCYEVR